MSRNRKSSAPAAEFPFRATLHRRVLDWYRRHGRVLPWRDEATPYEIMVSEFMLQQTQVSRVRVHLPRWLERFPTLAALSEASRRDVLIAWSGMGYNRRALHLHAAARMVIEQHGGVLPSDPVLLRALPGFGRYTAHAVACFGFRARHAMVDINIRRVLSRISAAMPDERAMLPEADAWRLAEELLPLRAFFNWNQALMDLGALVCTARRPRCGSCPAASSCASAHGFASAHRPESTQGTLSTQGILSTQGTLSRQGTLSAQGTLSTTRPATRSAAGGPDAIPRRIHRGKVVEHLRTRERHCASAAVLHRLLFGDGDEHERMRLLDILHSLQADGMILVGPTRRASEDLRQYGGTLRALRVCLAE